MVGTIVVHGTRGRVMAPIGGGEFLEGERRDILVTTVSDDEDLPLKVREALVGLTVSTIFSSEDLKGAVPEGSRAAYGTEVADTLKVAGKTRVANELLAALAANDPESQYQWLVFKSGEYTFFE